MRGVPPQKVIMLSVVVNVSDTHKSVTGRPFHVHSKNSTGTRTGPSSGTGTRPRPGATVSVVVPWILHSYVSRLSLYLERTNTGSDY